MVKKEEMNYWKQLSIQHMTEESDGSDADTLVVYELQWHSQSMHYYHGNCNNYHFTYELLDLLHLLDKRYEDKVKNEGTSMARKKRVSGEPSQSQPLSSTPKWTLDTKWVEVCTSVAIINFASINNYRTFARM